MDKLKMHSPNLTQDNIARLRELFPGCVTEAQGTDGKPKLAVDFDQLRQELSDSIVEGSQERYHLNWPGKREALLTANAPIAKTLRPCRDESVDFENTKNLFIEGDNLDALKLLQETYLGKVKMIYIDPPYNTGNDFIYEDDFAINTETYKLRSNQFNEIGGRLVSNTEANGRFHSGWLSMIFPRLKLARNLLSENGVLFISINDAEQENLRKVCDEIFGEKNFVATLVWNTEGNTDNQFQIKINHEYILLYCKNINNLDSSIGYVVDPNTPPESNLWKGYADNNVNKNNPANPPSVITLPKGFPCSEPDIFYPKKYLDSDFFDVTKKEKYISDSIKDKYRLEPRSGLPVKIDDMVVENHILSSECRIYVGAANKNKLLDFIGNDCKPVMDDDGSEIEFYINANAAVRYRKKREKARNILSVLKGFGTTERTRNILRRSGLFFDYPKPLELLEYLVQIGCEDRAGIVIDFFCGSGTSAQAIQQINSRDCGHRKFIMVQLPESCDNKSEAYKVGHKTISDISKARITSMGEEIKKASSMTHPNLDVGFRVLKIDTSNMADIHYTPDALNKSELELFVDNIKPDRTSEDLLFQVMLDWGVDLALPISRQTIQGKEVFFVDGNALAACFDAHSGIDEALVKELATHHPLRVVFRDAGFKDSAVKINVEQIFKLLSPATEVKCL